MFAASRLPTIKTRTERGRPGTEASLQPPSADHMTRRAKCIRNAMRIVIQLWGRALTFSTSLNFYAFNVRETAVIYIYLLYIYIVTARPSSPQEGARSRSPQLLVDIIQCDSSECKQ